MRESELLEHIERRSRVLAGRGGVEVGPGDDAAVVRLTGETLLTVDQLVGGRHFDPAKTSVDEIARKAVARSVSDIAAMGGRPVAGLATGCLPRGCEFGDALFDRMFHWALHWGCPLVGGDISVSDGPLVLTVTVAGRVHESRGAVLRSGARAGDSVYVTGALGGSLVSGRHLSFEPRVEEAAWLCGLLGDRLRSMIDLSDGLGRDAARVGRASGVRVRLEAAALPLHRGVADWRAGASDGEDYELLFTVERGAMVPACCEATGTAVTRIGTVVAGTGCVIVGESGEEYGAENLGWEHSG
ncbi:MAG: thiamine-phosphate kinase [Phycisphaerae bacterium]|nr:thiamine-phosphate kinase [Phycisphaerae bacterium]